MKRNHLASASCEAPDPVSEIVFVVPERDPQNDKKCWFSIDFIRGSFNFRSKNPTGVGELSEPKGDSRNKIINSALVGWDGQVFFSPVKQKQIGETKTPARFWWKSRKSPK